jgi:cystathionine beta-lyase/cystathionine gamma-synthase
LLLLLLEKMIEGAPMLLSRAIRNFDAANNVRRALHSNWRQPTADEDEEIVMFDRNNDAHDEIHSETAVLTRGFDPKLSVNSARPAVFRSSTYVFATPEEAERAFSVMAGRIPGEHGRRAELVYSRFSHPNAEILEDQIVPLETGATQALVFNSGMAAIMTAFFTFAKPDSTILYTVPLYGGTTTLIHQFLEPFGVAGVAMPAGDSEGIERAIRESKNPCIVMLETPANPTLIMADIRRAAEAAKAHPAKPILNGR